MIVISGALVLTALVLLVIGILDTDLPFVYASIGVSLASLLSLVVGILQRRGEVPDEAVHEREPTPVEQVGHGEGAPDEQDRDDQLATILAQAPPGESQRPGSRRVAPAEAPAGPLVVDEDDREQDEARDDEHDELPGTDDVPDPYDDEADDQDYDEDDDEPDDDGTSDDAADGEAAERDPSDLEEHDDPGDDAHPASGSGPTVLVVDGRPRYHLAGCRYLIGKDAQVIGLHDAREIGFSPCGVCKPDSVVEPAGPESAPPVRQRPAEVADDPAGQPDSPDGPGLSFEEVLFGEPVFGSAPDEPQPPTSDDDRDDTQTLPVLAGPEPEATDDGSVEQDRQDEVDEVDEVHGDASQEPVAEDRAPSSVGLAVPSDAEGEPAAPSATGAEAEAEAEAEGESEADVEPSPPAEPPVEAPASAGAAPDAGVMAATDEDPGEQAPAGWPAPASAAEEAPSRKKKAAAAKQPPAKKAPAKKAPAKKAPAKKAPAKKAPAKKAPARKAATTAPTERLAAGQAPEREAAPRSGARAPAGPARPGGMTVRAAAPKLPPGVLRTGPGRTAVVAAPRVGARPSAGASPAAGAARGGEQVVVTPDSRRFHRSTCRYVRDAPGATSLSPDRARGQGYARCGVCKP